MTANPANIKTLFIGDFDPIVRDQGASRKVYADALGTQFEELDNGYMHTEGVEGGRVPACGKGGSRP